MILSATGRSYLLRDGKMSNATVLFDFQTFLQRLIACMQPVKTPLILPWGFEGLTAKLATCQITDKHTKGQTDKQMEVYQTFYPPA